jgi:hypothetical protein
MEAVAELQEQEPRAQQGKAIFQHAQAVSVQERRGAGTCYQQAPSPEQFARQEPPRALPGSIYRPVVGAAVGTNHGRAVRCQAF